MLPYIRLSPGAVKRSAGQALLGVGDLPTGIFMTDDAAPIVRRRPDGSLETRIARWGMPSPGREMRTRAIHRAYRARMKLTDLEFERFAANEPDTGAPFIDASAFIWRSSLEPSGRCVVPFSAVGVLSVGNSRSLGDEYVFPPSCTLGFLGGVYETGWRGVRRAELGPETLDLFGLVSVERIVQSELYSRAFTPIVLADPGEVDIWLSAPWAKAKTLRRKRWADAIG